MTKITRTIVIGHETTVIEVEDENCYHAAQALLNASRSLKAGHNHHHPQPELDRRANGCICGQDD